MTITLGLTCKFLCGKDLLELSWICSSIYLSLTYLGPLTMTPDSLTLDCRWVFLCFSPPGLKLRTPELGGPYPTTKGGTGRLLDAHLCTDHLHPTSHGLHWSHLVKSKAVSSCRTHIHKPDWLQTSDQSRLLPPHPHFAAHSLVSIWMVVPETERKSSTDVMSSTASVRTRTCFSHWSLKTSMLSWATLLWGLAASVRAALITCESGLTFRRNGKSPKIFHSAFQPQLESTLSIS